MSIINVSGLTMLVGLVMQNDFFIISRWLRCLQACDLSSPSAWLSLFFYCQIVLLYQLFIFSSIFGPLCEFPSGGFFLSCCCFLKTGCIIMLFFPCSYHSFYSVVPSLVLFVCFLREKRNQGFVLCTCSLQVTCAVAARSSVSVLTAQQRLECTEKRDVLVGAAVFISLGSL